MLKYDKSDAEKLYRNSLYYIYIGFMFLSTKYKEFVEWVFQNAPNIKNSEIILFDLETTGLNPYHNKIIDYAFINFENKEESINSLVNPQTKFEKKITDITGIHPDQLEDKPTIKECLPSIYEFINYNSKQYGYKTLPIRYLVAHNCLGFDKTFLLKEFNKESDKYPHTKQWKFIDTLLIAKKLFPEMHSHSLKSLATHYNITPGNHSALSDTVALYEIFEKLLDDFCKKTNISSFRVIENPDILIDYYTY